MRARFLIPMALLLSAVVVLSCEKDSSQNVNPGRNTGINMAADVIDAAEYIETKSGAIAQLKNVYGEPGDDFIITEYVTDIAAALPQTKGTEIKTGNIDSKYGRFHTVAYVEDAVNFSLDAVAPSWGWDGDAPKWISRVDYNIWSYAPVSMESGLTVTKDQITFTHTVPKVLEEQQDLVFAHNVERRNFYDPASKSFKAVESDPEKDPNFKVKFYHALSAVKFQLSTATAGADVHSITLCYIDPDTHQIVTSNAGIATTGDCTVTSSGSGSGTVSFNWQNVGTPKPLHYEFADLNTSDPSYVASKTIKGSYAKDYDGVLFMIPQNVQNISIIVEFSKYGGKKYYTKVKTLNNINWQAGKFYLYDLSIGEFHVPGEILYGTNSLYMEKFQGGENRLVLNNNLPIKGVKRVGMYLSEDPSIKVNKDGVMVLMAERNGILSSPLAKTIIKTSATTLSFNFQEIDSRLINNSTADPEVIYEFGLNNTSEETYYSYDYYEKEGTARFPRYYVYDTDGWTSFNLGMHVESGNNGNNITLNVKGIMVLEVATDPNFPSNFSTINWDNI